MIRISLCAAALLASAALSASEDPKALIEATCTPCHSLRTVERAMGYSRADWQTLTANMIDLSGDPEVEAQILDYLAATYPPNNPRPATQVDGPRTLDIESWKAPTLGQRPRDPIDDAQGRIWWAGQGINLVGYVDPATGAMREYDLPDGAYPHSVTPGEDGMIWYTGNKNGTIGRLDPDTGAVTEYPMPDPAAKDPHTHIFDHKGRLWFTVQWGNMVGRLIPETGAVTLVPAPTPRSRPYGIKQAKNGDIYAACNGSNCLLKLDAETMALTEIELPGDGTHVRRLDVGPDGMIWWTNSGLGRLGRYNPDTGEIKEWPSPSGPKSHPYGIAVHKGGVWYNESGTRPDLLVRFDIKTETFQSWTLPSDGIVAGQNRHFRQSRDGESLLVHQTATNRIMRVTVKGQ